MSHAKWSSRGVFRFVCVLIFAAVATFGHAQVFISAPRVNTGGSSGPAYPGDFNGDGKLDMAVIGYKSIDILLGNGNGTFQPYHSFLATVNSLAVGDFDHDGKLDLATSNAGVIQIYAGRGDGTFRLSGSPSATSPGSLAVADMNADGKLDLIFSIASRDVQGIGVLLGNGDGTFRSEIDTTFNRSVAQIKIGDFNSDGKPDVVGVVPSSFIKTTVRVLLGNGDGTLQAPVDSLIQDLGYTLALDDFNNDGHLDVAVEGRGNNEAWVLFGVGDGHLRNTRSFPVGLSPRAVVAADFDGDGKSDLATVNADDNSVSVLFGLGTGGFKNRLDYDAGENAFDLSVADFNGDGKPDLAAPLSVACCEANAVSVLMNNGDGTFYASRLYDSGVPNAWTVATGDLNGDGSPDIVVGAQSSSVSVLIGKGDGTFGDPRLFPITNGSVALVLADFNHDGKLDVVCACDAFGQGASTVSVLLGNGDGTLQASLDTPLSGFAQTIAVGDLNRDGNPDVIVGEQNTWPHPGDIAVLTGNGDGTFQLVGNYFTGGKGESPYPVIADVNGDGKSDILICNGSSVLGVLLGKGDGTFRSRLESKAGAHLFSMTTADLNGDGNVDVVSAGSSGGAGGSTGVMFGNGDGSFGTLVPYDSARGPHQPSVADFNLDGFPDVAVTNIYGTVSAFLNNGDGTLQPRTDYAVGDYSEQNAVADFNGDGYPDLVVANSGAGFNHNVTVLLNKGAQ